MWSIRVCSSSKSLCPSVGTVVPYMYGKLACLVLFTNNPPRREFRCPLYRVSALWHNHNTHTLATYEENKGNSIVTLNMNHLYSIWCLITQYLTIRTSTQMFLGFRGSCLKWLGCGHYGRLETSPMPNGWSSLWWTGQHRLVPSRQRGLGFRQCRSCLGCAWVPYCTHLVLTDSCLLLKMRPSVAATDYKCCSSCLSLWQTLYML